MSKYYVTFTGKAAADVLKTAGFSQHGYRRIYTRHEVHELFEMFIANGLAHTRYSQSLCGSLLATLAYKISEQALPSDNVSSRAYTTYLRVRGFVDHNNLALKTVEQVADEMRSRCRIYVNCLSDSTTSAPTNTCFVSACDTRPTYSARRECSSNKQPSGSTSPINSNSRAPLVGYLEYRRPSSSADWCRWNGAIQTI